MFETDYKDKNDLLPEGEYECIIKAAFINATNSARPTEYFSVCFVIRNDVPQKYQNKNIFHAIWNKKEKNRTSDDNKIGGFSYKQIMNLCQASGVPKGKSFKDLNDLGEYLKGRCVLVTVEHGEWDGKIQEKVKWTNKTKYPECKHIFTNADKSGTALKAAAAAVSEIIDETDISADDDLPF